MLINLELLQLLPADEGYLDGCFQTRSCTITRSVTCFTTSGPPQRHNRKYLIGMTPGASPGDALNEGIHRPTALVHEIITSCPIRMPRPSYRECSIMERR
jgi:hypothetical protein